MIFISCRRFAGMFVTAALTLGLAVAGHANVMSSGDKPVTVLPPGAAIVGGAAMLTTKNIFDDISQSGDHTTLVAALKASGLDNLLSGPTPYILLAPNNAAFAKLPKDMLPEATQDNKDKLAALVGYHIVPGHIAEKDLRVLATQGAKIPLVNIQGRTLNVVADKDANLSIEDENGGKAAILQSFTPTNGVVYIIDGVLLPKQP